MKKTFIYILLLVFAMSCSKDEPTPPTPPEPPIPTKVLVANTPEEVAEKLKEAIEIKKQTGEIWTVTTAKGVNYVAGGADWEVLKNNTDEAIKNGVILRFSTVDGNWEEMPKGYFDATRGSNTVQTSSGVQNASSSYVSTTVLQDPIGMDDIVAVEGLAQSGSTTSGNPVLIVPYINANSHEGDEVIGDGMFNGKRVFEIAAAPLVKVRKNRRDPNLSVSANAEVLGKMPKYFNKVTIDQSENKWVLIGFSVDDIYNSTTTKDQRRAETAQFKFENGETAFGQELHVKDGQGLPIELTWELGGTFENGQKDVTCRINYSYDEHQQPNYVAATAAQSVPNARIPMVLPNRVPGENDNSFVEIGDEYYGLVGLEQQLKFAQRVVPGYDDCKYKVTNGKAVVVVPTMNPKQYFGAVATDMTWPDYAWTICHTDTVAMVFVYAPHAFSGKVSSKEEMLKTARVLTSAGDTLSQKAAPIMFVGSKKNSLARICNPCQ